MLFWIEKSVNRKFTETSLSKYPMPEMSGDGCKPKELVPFQSYLM